MTSATKDTTTVEAFEAREVADGDRRIRLFREVGMSLTRHGSPRGLVSMLEECPPNLAFCDENQIPFEATLDRSCLWGSLTLTRMGSGVPYL